MYTYISSLYTKVIPRPRVDYIPKSKFLDILKSEGWTENDKVYIFRNQLDGCSNYYKIYKLDDDIRAMPGHISDVIEELYPSPDVELLASVTFSETTSQIQIIVCVRRISV